MNVSKRFVLVFLLLRIISSTYSQNSLKDLPFKERVYAGGNFGLALGNVSTFVEAAPFVGYRITEKFSAGIGANYTHLRYNDGFFKTKLDIFGVNVFARRIINQSFFAHVEYEMLNVAPRFVQFDNKKRIWVEGLLVGGGFRQPFGNNSAFITTILFNLLESAETPYRNPIYRAGFYIGF
jgi:hypothetical protein